MIINLFQGKSFYSQALGFLWRLRIIFKTDFFLGLNFRFWIVSEFEESENQKDSEKVSEFEEGEDQKDSEKVSEFESDDKSTGDNSGNISPSVPSPAGSCSPCPVTPILPSLASSGSCSSYSTTSSPAWPPPASSSPHFIPNSPTAHSSFTESSYSEKSQSPGPQVSQGPIYMAHLTEGGDVEKQLEKGGLAVLVAGCFTGHSLAVLGRVGLGTTTNILSESASGEVKSTLVRRSVFSTFATLGIVVTDMGHIFRFYVVVTVMGHIFRFSRIFVRSLDSSIRIFMSKMVKVFTQFLEVIHRMCIRFLEMTIRTLIKFLKIIVSSFTFVHRKRIIHEKAEAMFGWEDHQGDMASEIELGKHRQYVNGVAVTKDQMNDDQEVRSDSLSSCRRVQRERNLLTLSAGGLNRASRERDAQLICKPPDHQHVVLLEKGKQDPNQLTKVVVMIGQRFGLRFTVGKMDYNESRAAALAKPIIIAVEIGLDLLMFMIGIQLLTGHPKLVKEQQGEMILARVKELSKMTSPLDPSDLKGELVETQQFPDVHLQDDLLVIKESGPLGVVAGRQSILPRSLFNTNVQEIILPYTGSLVWYHLDPGDPGKQWLHLDKKDEVTQPGLSTEHATNLFTVHSTLHVGYTRHVTAHTSIAQVNQGERPHQQGCTRFSGLGPDNSDERHLPVNDHNNDHNLSQTINDQVTHVTSQSSVEDSKELHHSGPVKAELTQAQLDGRDWPVVTVFTPASDLGWGSHVITQGSSVRPAQLPHHHVPDCPGEEAAPHAEAGGQVGEHTRGQGRGHAQPSPRPSPHHSSAPATPQYRNEMANSPYHMQAGSPAAGSTPDPASTPQHPATPVTPGSSRTPTARPKLAAGKTRGGHHLRQAASRAKEIWLAPRKGGDGSVPALHQEDPHQEPVYGHGDLYAKGVQHLDPNLTPQTIPVLPGNAAHLESVLRSGTEGDPHAEAEGQAGAHAGGRGRGHVQPSPRPPPDPGPAPAGAAADVLLLHWLSQPSSICDWKLKSSQIIVHRKGAGVPEEIKESSHPPDNRDISRNSCSLFAKVTVLRHMNASLGQLDPQEIVKHSHPVHGHVGLHSRDVQCLRPSLHTQSLAVLPNR